MGGGDIGTKQDPNQTISALLEQLSKRNQVITALQEDLRRLGAEDEAKSAVASGHAGKDEAAERGRDGEVGSNGKLLAAGAGQPDDASQAPRAEEGRQYRVALASLLEQLSKRAQYISALREEVTKLEQELRATNQTLALKEAELRATNQTLALKEAELRATNQTLALKEAELRATNQTLALKQAELQVARSTMAIKDAELRKIKSSFGWRLLSRYGKVKYGYLLPVYRWLTGGERDAGDHISPSASPSVSPSASPSASPSTSEDSPRVDVLERVQPARKVDLICFPIIDWGFRFQRPQQLATQFASNGHRVFYLNTTFNGGSRLSVQLTQTAASMLSALDVKKGVAETLSPCIVSVDLPGPSDVNLYRHEIDSETLDVLSKGLTELRAGAGISEAVCLVQLPFWAPVAFEARRRWGWKVVYDCLDEHSGFSTNAPAMLNQEASIIDNADLVVASSEHLLNKINEAARNTLQLPNATDFDHFNSPRGERPLGHLARPIIGYYGAISDWFDVEMVRFAAASRPNWQFVLIGDTFGADVSSLREMPNVHMLGELPYAALPGYLHQFDVACIPFLLTPLTAATNPVKFYEYLSAGKPVVAVDLPDLRPYRDFYYPVRSKEDFVAQIEIALGEDTGEKRAARINFARSHTWRRRYDDLNTAFSKLFGKVAIIIVSYINLDYLKLCLESIWSKTSYPNFEVIVVDNGGRQEIVEYLRSEAVINKRLRVIFNSENLGFARANNIGIRAAVDSEYIVLLNDDTIVTNGWLGRMVGYLQDDRIGLIGPVTNWAGNEAKIDVDYSGIEGIDEFARRHVRERDGSSFDIKMLAMYCIGIRKSLLNEIGLLDEQFGIGMFEDDDFSLRVRKAGYRVVCAEDIFIHHWGKASFGKLDDSDYDRLFEENRRKFEEKWGQPWQPHRARGVLE
jgi:GT2 family glycosyltransferase